jgi:hypothetical protein
VNSAPERDLAICAKCGSTDVRSVPMAWATAPLGSTLKQLIAQPRLPAPVGTIALTATFLLFALMLAVPPANHRPGALEWCGIAAIALLTIFAFVRHLKRRTRHSLEVAAWSRRWVCLVCGTMTGALRDRHEN